MERVTIWHGTLPRSVRRRQCISGKSTKDAVGRAIDHSGQFTKLWPNCLPQKRRPILSISQATTRKLLLKSSSLFSIGKCSVENKNRGPQMRVLRTVQIVAVILLGKDYRYTLRCLLKYKSLLKTGRTSARDKGVNWIDLLPLHSSYTQFHFCATVRLCPLLLA